MWLSKQIFKIKLLWARLIWPKEYPIKMLLSIPDDLFENYNTAKGCSIELSSIFPNIEEACRLLTIVSLAVIDKNDIPPSVLYRADSVTTLDTQLTSSKKTKKELLNALAKHITQFQNAINLPHFETNQNHVNLAVRLNYSLSQLMSSILEYTYGRSP